MRTFLYLIVLLTGLVFKTYGQSDAELFYKLKEFIKDSAYVSVFPLIQQQMKQQPQWGGHYFNRALARYRTNDFKGMCQDFSMAQRLNINLNGFKRYYNFYCETDPQKNKYLKELYEQKGMTISNNYHKEYTMEDSLRGKLYKERRCFDVNYYNLDIKLDPKKKTISGFNEIAATMVETSDVIQIDMHNALELDSIVFEGKSILSRRVFNAVYISFPRKLEKDSSLLFTVFYHGKPAIAKNPPWQGGFVWKKNKSSKVWASVACEHLGASFWWPCKNHPSDEPDSMDVTIAAPKPYKAVSNGNLVSEMETGDGYTKFKWHISYPINSYNVTFYIGNFVSYKEKYTNNSGDHYLEFYVMPHNLERAQKHFKQSHEIIRFYEDAFGEYPFWKDGFALVESPYAGMEHQSAIAIGGDYGEETRRYYKKAEYDYLVVHEAAHEWWGNSVTAGDMCDAWLQEGFATYAELMFIENKYGYGEYLDEVATKVSQVLNIWPVIGKENINDNSFIGGDIYQKGALVLHNLRCSINNDSLFFSIIKEFAVSNKIKIVRTRDFINLVNKRTGKNWEPFFNAFLNQTQVPTVEYTFQNTEEGLEIFYKWINVGAGFEMPFSIKLSDHSYVRLTGTDKEQKTLFIKNKFFNFVSPFTGVSKSLKNAYTFHYTRFSEFNEYR